MRWVPRLLACAFAAGLVAVPTAQAVVPFQHLTGPGPITSLNLGNDLTCQMAVAGDPQPSFEPIGAQLGDCATYVLATNTATGDVVLFGPTDRTFIPNGDQPYAPDTSTGPEGQQAIPAGPDTTVVGTGATLGATGLHITQTDVYNRAQNVFTSGVDLANNDPNVAYDVTVARVFLCYLQTSPGDDFGVHDLFQGTFERPGCTSGPGVSPARTEALTGIGADATTPINWVVAAYGDTAALLRAGPFPNTCQCGTASDLMVGLSWPRPVESVSSVSDANGQTTSSGPQAGATPQPERTGTAATES